MKPSSYPTVLISVAVAVVLWLGATWLEDDSRWLPNQPEPVALPDIAKPRPDTPLRLNSGPMSCQQAEEEMVRRVEEARYCTTDDDCTLFDYGYPIQCMTSVARSEITALRLQYRRYEESCEYRVYYDCPSGSLERQAVCRQNRCGVELADIDPLKDATLQHLGIKDP